jgi:rhomboid family GlyGly-CTERM serine protease
MLERAPVSVALGAVCLLLAGSGEPIASALAWDRAAILQGELWRLWSAHLVHFSASHAGANALVLVALGMAAEPLAGSRRFAQVLVAGALLISLGLLVLAPGLQEYRGASGLAVLTAVLGGQLAWRRYPGSRQLLACAALALAGKTFWEAFASSAGFAELPAGVGVAWQAHVLGALVGGYVAAVVRSPQGRASHG